jgi:hypothetical protein
MELTREEIAWLVAVCPRSLEVWAGKNGIACVGICPFPFATVATINPDKDVDFAKLFATAPALAALALALMDERDRYRTALERLRDCDWTISLPDRMDAVRDIARAALEPR